ncbi:DUF1858 domain-containing protein [Desulfofundulus sp. TPOSR]|nr:DUF1858 domain-containing protein [Desulfofundulus sp. TPOSR]NHM26778.1 DUF1858 domain-containing protein [Desulfofundulus sp. TPOSR]
MINPQMRISEVINRFPGTRRFFDLYGIGCFG